MNLSALKISNTEREKLQELVCKFQDVFALHEQELGKTNLVKHSIHTRTHAPVKQRPYRTPVCRRQKIEELVEGMQEQGVVCPSSSPWASPVVLVPKKDGSSRFCVDYRRLNSITRKDVYPLPRIEDILDTLGGAKYFSSLDLLSGYWQVELDDDAKQKSAFITHHGLFEFVRMPFGLCNAPATFQRLMQRVLTGLEGKMCFVFIDDILVYSQTFEEHLECLQTVFTRLREAGLRLKPKKCALLQEEITFLGHVVSPAGIQPDPEKTDKVKHYPQPTDATKVRQFLGLASYYRRFVAGFAKIARPLNQLTRKDAAFEWAPECEDSFMKLKQALCSAPVLAYPLFGTDKTFILETDASTEGLGAVLSQTQADGTIHPIAYASRSLDKHERNYGISELETLGLVWAARYFRPYLLGHPCVVYTDHVACLSILNTSRPSGKLARWALTIQELDLTIKRKPGKSNTNADALSRNPVSVNAVGAEERFSSEVVSDLARVATLQSQYEKLLLLMEYLKDNKVPADDLAACRVVAESRHYSLIDGTLHYESPHKPGHWLVVVPVEIQQAVLEEAHGGLFAGHFSENKVYDRLRRYVWWRGMKSAVRRHCRKCLVCVTRRGTRKTFKPALQPIPVGGPFHRVAVDVLQLPQTVNGNRYVVVFMDYLTNWLEAFPTQDQTAETIAGLFVEHIVCRHGIPEQLLSDRGTNFLSSVVQGVCKLLGVDKLNTSGYHPQTDGLVEKFNSTIISMVAKSAEKGLQNWDERLPCLLFAYRASAQESTKESPFYLLYGRDPRIPTATVLSQERSVYEADVQDYSRELALNLSTAWKLAQENIRGAQMKQKKQYDRSSTPPTLKVSDRVMVYMPSEVKGKNRKLARPFHGPYRVLSVTPTNAEVRLVDDLTSAPIFVSLDRVRHCYPEQEDICWTGGRKRRKARSPTQPDAPPPEEQTAPYTGPTTRSRARRSGETSETD